MTADDREAEVLELLDAAIERLDPREREVLELWFGFEGEAHTLRAIGELIGVSRSYAAVLAHRALRKLGRRLASRWIEGSEGGEYLARLGRRLTMLAWGERAAREFEVVRQREDEARRREEWERECEIARAREREERALEAAEVAAAARRWGVERDEAIRRIERRTLEGELEELLGPGWRPV